MAHSKITLIGAYGYFKNIGEDLFSNLALPEGLEKDTLIDNILNRGSDFELVYGSPVYLQSAIGSWCAVNRLTFERWVKLINIEYNPLDNYNRHEEWDDNRETSGTGDSESNGESSNTSENKRSAFDASTYQPNEENTSSGSASDTTHNETAGTDDAHHEGHLWGNIGVTTTQAMFMEEANLGYWNIYEKITEMFLREFTIPVYC